MSQTLTLVSHHLCPYVQRAVIVAAEKGIALERILIDLAAKPAWFLALSPTGKVPLLRMTDERGEEHVLFESAAAGWGADAVGVVLTGMGDDGLEGSRAIRAAGGHVLTESANSCVVYGMPRVVVEAGLSNGSASLEDMAELLERYVR